MAWATGRVETEPDQARQARLGLAWCRDAEPDQIGQGKAGEATLGKTRQGEIRRHEARQAMRGLGYWKDETGRELRPAIMAFLNNAPMTPRQISLMRDYLKHWIDYPGWGGERSLAKLRTEVDTLDTREKIDIWLREAIEIGIDPI